MSKKNTAATDSYNNRSCPCHSNDFIPAVSDLTAADTGKSV